MGPIDNHSKSQIPKYNRLEQIEVFNNRLQIHRVENTSRFQKANFRIAHFKVHPKTQIISIEVEDRV